MYTLSEIRLTQVHPKQRLCESSYCITCSLKTQHSFECLHTPNESQHAHFSSKARFDQMKRVILSRRTIDPGHNRITKGSTDSVSGRSGRPTLLSGHADFDSVKTSYRQHRKPKHSDIHSHPDVIFHTLNVHTFITL